MELLEKLVKIQQAAGLSDRKFGPRLGVSGALWNQVRNGRVPIRFELLAGVAREFPDLRNDMIDFLASSAANTGSKSHKEAASTGEAA